MSEALKLAEQLWVIHDFHAPGAVAPFLRDAAEMLKAQAAEIERLKNELETQSKHFSLVLKKAEAERDALKADAERYRWLREGDNDERVLCNGPVDMLYWYLLRREKLDAAIDAAKEKP